MAALLISNGASYGSLTNQSVSRLIALQQSIIRLQEAIATASSGFEGVPGTQFESGMSSNGEALPPNNFGVQTDPANPGANGQAYAYAIEQLKTQWDTFWAAAEPYIAALDNGYPAF